MNNIKLRYRNFLAYSFLSIALVLPSCQPSSSLTGKNISHLYRSEVQNDILEVDYKVAHKQGQKSDLRFKLNLSSLGESEGTRGFSLRYRLYQNYSSSIPIDSGFQVFKDIIGSESNENRTEISIPSGRNHMLEVDLIDLYSKKRTRSYLDIINPTQFSEQSYSLVNNEGELISHAHVLQADSYSIQTAEILDHLFVRFYNRNFPVASPPFSAVNNNPFDFTPDRLTELSRDLDGRYKLYVVQSGIYQLASDTNSRNGGSVFYFGEHYPKARTINDLLLPLRYLTTTPEFQSLKKGENLKKGIDNYWLNVGGSPERAKMLIETYYTRVEQANTLFASYLEGWKTDRGMCLIVFGEPNKVVRSTASETWLYGEVGKYNTLKLTFTKVQNPFTTNDFRLNRNASLKSPWYRAVEFWRQGRIITY